MKTFNHILLHGLLFFHGTCVELAAGWYCAWQEIDGKVLGSMTWELDSTVLAKNGHQVIIWDRDGLQVDVRGFGLPRAHLSWIVETKILAGRTPLKHLLLHPGDERIVVGKPGMAEDNGWRRETSEEKRDHLNSCLCGKESDV